MSTKIMRSPWDNYFMDIAVAVATRATCSRKHVGAVIVRDKTILSTGYNGSIRGMEHCDDAGHLMEDGHCIRTIHAEANAILQAAKNGVAIDGATLYSTASPCWPCFGLVANSGIRRIVFGDAYRARDPGPKRVSEVAKLAGIELVDLAAFVTPKVFDEAQLAAATAQRLAHNADPTTRHARPVAMSQCTNCDWTGPTPPPGEGCPKCRNKMLVEVP